MIRVDAFPAPVPGGIVPRSWHEAVGSSGAGKAMNLGRLGVDVTLHCLLGRDDAGHRVRAALEEAGVIVDAVDDPSGTARHVNLMDGGGRRMSFMLHRGDPEIRPDRERVAALVAAADEVLVAITDHGRDVLPIARQLGKRTWTDLHGTDGSREAERNFWTADRIFFSDERLPDPRPFMRRLHETGRELVVCTMGGDGALAITDDGRWLDIPAEPVETIVDTNGAGDAFLAGTVYGELQGLAIEDALRLGARVAALAVQSPDLAPARIDPARLGRN
ncbi:MAG: acarbose 7IV-phosphotransferase [Chloroflexota bacterium]|nr:acarbose 7IV-phosphotransferase [Chloroflexota bacterium]